MKIIEKAAALQDAVAHIGQGFAISSELRIRTPGRQDDLFSGFDRFLHRAHRIRGDLLVCRKQGPVHIEGDHLIVIVHKAAPNSFNSIRVNRVVPVSVN